MVTAVGLTCLLGGVFFIEEVAGLPQAGGGFGYPGAAGGGFGNFGAAGGGFGISGAPGGGFGISGAPGGGFGISGAPGGGFGISGSPSGGFGYTGYTGGYSAPHRPVPVPTVRTEIPNFGAQGCELNGVVYQSGDITADTCLIMQCNNGTWEYQGRRTGNRRTDCGQCSVEGDPHFYIFDQTSFLNLDGYRNKYKFGGIGNHVITQDGYSRNSLFGVTSTFEICNTECGCNLTCVKSITYYEPGVTVDVALPPQETNYTYPECTKSGVDPTTDPNCKFTVRLNNKVREITDKATRIGNVLVFIQNHIMGNGDLFCMNVVGSQGLSVSLCQHRENFAFLYVFPMATIRDDPSQLFGLCNTYTGTTQGNFIAGPYLSGIVAGSKTQRVDNFGDSWKL